MQITFGLGGRSGLRWQRYLRGLVAAAATLAGVFTFVSVDLARRDAVFSPSVMPTSLENGDGLEVTLLNESDHVMENADISFRLYDRSGAMIIFDENGDGTEDQADLADHHFAPKAMTIPARSSLVGLLLDDSSYRDFNGVQFLAVCAVFDGSFWVDRVRTTYLLERLPIGGFGQVRHAKDVHFLSEPDCGFTASVPAVH
ncbi:hypothetical protein OEZ60_10985 [Defluviimonas sp. WL0024]|uniref:Uncharacterized protein n=1 Tax=Albidovulum salinarum TaxID=2984153 RepID=A0ABT2X3J9_9RHOB|nr:hypothetical protein [Defluviimonas sp. WL0024]MCU9848535.1 hypothetical protein [Defluviimonas sp. WL0024]